MGYVNFCRVRIHILTVKNAGDLPSENMFQLPKFLVMVWPAVVIPNEDLSLPSSYFIATIRSNERTSLPTSHREAGCDRTPGYYTRPTCPINFTPLQSPLDFSLLLKFKKVTDPDKKAPLCHKVTTLLCYLLPVFSINVSF